MGCSFPWTIATAVRLKTAQIRKHYVWDYGTKLSIRADIECIVRFRQTCKRYHIDFSTVAPDEKVFAVRMAEKLALRRA